MRTIQRFCTLAPLGLIALSTLSAHAADPVTDNQWHGALSIGGAAASGNTSSDNLSLSADGTKASTTDKLNLYALSNNGRAKINGVTNTTADLFRLGGRYDYNLSSDLFVFGGGEYETNKAAAEDSRLNLNTGLGYKLHHTADATLDLFGGLGYSDVRYTDSSSHSGAELMVGEEGNYKLSPSSTFKQRVAYYPGSNGLGRRATVDAGLSTAISGAWTLNMGLSVRYASVVPVGVKTTDTLLTFGFGYKY